MVNFFLYCVEVLPYQDATEEMLKNQMIELERLGRLIKIGLISTLSLIVLRLGLKFRDYYLKKTK